MELRIGLGDWPRGLEAVFPQDAMDAFHTPGVNRALYGSNWKSVLFSEGEKRFFHLLVARPIGETGWNDVEPLFGYAGPVVWNGDADFIRRAWAGYRDFCRQERIIAELFRFHPILENRLILADQPEIRIFPVKPIVLMACRCSPDNQLSGFGEACRRRVRRGASDCVYRRLEGEAGWDRFEGFYRDFAGRVNIAPHWRMAGGFFGRVRREKGFEVHAVFRGERMASATVVIKHPTAAYYLLAANSPELFPGANEFLIHSVGLDCAAAGITTLILGGGRTDLVADPLLRFKQKFSPARRHFYIGAAVYEPEVYESLCREAVGAQAPPSNQVLRYRLAMERAGK
ncbi:MAG: hypothetical protein COV76_01050 [Candidatus Omnitrophica bacterium CG11_big_fil_rev_8_21_14_0_20_64_10]|nr:MAG: hypothetical protein COV76_01050 [Candidatus Omnitrophica bacterium CG11_big_fil_rev_8_21_14_0_20_64_10]